MRYWLQGAVVLPDHVLEQGLVRVEESKITGIWDLTIDAAPRRDSEQTISLGEGYLAPGFIDLHVHGGGGADFMDGNPDAAAMVAKTHARYGTTGLLATIRPTSGRGIISAIRAARSAPRQGAKILGFHLEGPYLNPKMKGAMDASFFRRPSVAEIDHWLEVGGFNYRWHVTLAPEIAGALEVIRRLAGYGAVVSVGHTECTYEELRTAASAGLSHVTHLYNAMRGLHHREPGTVGGALTLPGLTAEVIADGIHVHPAALAVAVTARGTGRILLVTDAMCATGLADGEYDVGQQRAFVKEGAVRLADGTLAGSVLTMARAVRNMVQLVGMTLPTAVAMASLNPARCLGLDGQKGTIAVGKDADLAILDRNLEVVTTIIEGRTVFDPDGMAALLGAADTA